MAAHKEEWEGVDDELREEYRLLAEESREDRKPTTTKSAKNASKDVDAVVHGMIESVSFLILVKMRTSLTLLMKAKACFVRTGQSFIIMSVKSSTVSYAGATVYVSPPLEKFTGTVFKKTGPEILRLAESWAVHGAEGTHTLCCFIVASLKPAILLRCRSGECEDPRRHQEESSRPHQETTI